MKVYFLLFITALSTAACVNNSATTQNSSKDSSLTDSGRSLAGADTLPGGPDTLPPPFATESVKHYSKVIGWPAGKTPVAPAGFTVSKFADGLDNPRWLYEAPNGDIFVAEANTELKGIKKIGAKISPAGKSQKLGSSANSIILLRDADKDGIFEKKYVFADNLDRPLGMLIQNNHFYVANTDGLEQFDYTLGDSMVKGPAKQILSLPSGGYNNHWTRNIVASKNGDKIYVSVGSGSNVAEHGMENEKRRANILEINPDGSGEKIFASGLRNPVGMSWEPVSGKLWVAVNERDELGDELVPDYITSVKEGGFYGWPYSYFGQHPDPRLKDNPNTQLVNKAIVPDVAVGAHTASLGLAFYDRQAFPAAYRQGAFVGQHGSWNKSVLAGYKIMFVPFVNGGPSGKPRDFLTGFIADMAKDEVYGRPVGVIVTKDGALLVADDAGNAIWKVSAQK
ncbi:MAG: sorbosone dehydrogenase family protein [Chitinophagaceae bacterium]